MKNIDFRIVYWKTSKPHYELIVDGKSHLDNINESELRVIINEIEKFCRLRFKGELKHKKNQGVIR